MERMFRELPKNLLRCFSGKNLLFHAPAIVATFVLVQSGFDFAYSEYFRGTPAIFYLIPAGLLGFFVPVVLPFFLLAVGSIRKHAHTIAAGWAVIQANILAILTSWFYKALTGRAHPDFWTPKDGVDISAVFNFGFLEGGVFWGWPSSHTTVAFALAVTIILLYRNNVFAIFFASLFALYVGIGASATFHWFSDFVAGALLGTMIGVVVGNKTRENLGLVEAKGASNTLKQDNEN